MGLPRRTTRIWPMHYRARIAVALSRMRRAGVARKVLALMIHLSLAIYCAESSLAAPTYSVLTGTATEALPDNPGQVSVTLSRSTGRPKGMKSDTMSAIVPKMIPTPRLSSLRVRHS